MGSTNPNSTQVLQHLMNSFIQVYMTSQVNSSHTGNNVLSSDRWTLETGETSITLPLLYTVHHVQALKVTIVYFIHKHIHAISACQIMTINLVTDSEKDTSSCPTSFMKSNGNWGTLSACWTCTVHGCFFYFGHHNKQNFFFISLIFMFNWFNPARKTHES